MMNRDPWKSLAAFRRPIRRVVVSVGVLTGILAAGLALAAAGDLDPGFNQTGKFSIMFSPTTYTEANGVAVQTDGRIVVPLRFTSNDVDYFALMRLTAGGSLDSGFGDGVVLPLLSASAARAQAVALQKDGKIVAVGAEVVGALARFVVVRLNADGSRDSSFGSDGVAKADVAPGRASVAYAVAIQKDGKLVAAGTAGDDFAVVRFNPDGTLDPTFSGDGTVITDFGDEEGCHGVAIQRDGRIVAAGSTRGGGFALACYTPDGRLDRSFGRKGKVTTTFGGDDQASGLALQNDGKIVLVGSSYTTASRIAMARYERDGRLDRSFGKNGRVISDIGGYSAANAVVIQPDGRLVVAGSGVANNSFDFLVARYRKNGLLDPSFGGNGWVTTDFADQESASGVALQPDGKIVAAGVLSGGETQIAAARYLGQ